MGWRGCVTYQEVMSLVRTVRLAGTTRIGTVVIMKTSIFWDETCIIWKMFTDVSEDVRTVDHTALILLGCLLRIRLDPED